jgi:hypothetical protein
MCAKVAFVDEPDAALSGVLTDDPLRELPIGATDRKSVV